jgi:hypothetical protein
VRVKLLAIVVLCVLTVPTLFFLIRSPVLIVADESFVALYGQGRMKQEQRSASLVLFRRVKPVTVIDTASSDMIAAAIASVSSRPFCVIFPRRYSSAAMYYHQEAPQNPVVLLGGFVPASQLPSPEGSFFVYTTDRETDLYRAGLFSSILGDLRRGQEGEIDPSRQIVALWQDSFVTDGQRGLFSRGIKELKPEAAVVFARTGNDMPEIGDLSGVALTSAGAVFLERQPAMPIILFSWLDPSAASSAIAVLFDDSSWGLAVPAVRMAGKKQSEGKIPSKTLMVLRNIADKEIFRYLELVANKVP